MHSVETTASRRSGGSPRELLRDWRVRVLVPVILIHVVVFGGLYFLLYQLVKVEVEESYKIGGEIMLGTVSERFEGSMTRHHFSDLEGRLRRYARPGHFDLRLFDANKKLVASSGGDVAASVDAELDAALAPSPPTTAWYVQDGTGFRLNGVKPILNRAACHGCHSPKGAALGAIHMSIDLTHVMAATRQRLLFRIGLLLLAWAVLAVVMAYLRDIVIGRPIARIENVLRLINLPRRDRKDSGDLETLSDRVNQAVWTLLEEKKRQDASFRQHLARAEQMAALGELAAGLTHEIRNPIASVSSALQLMRSDEGDPPTERAHLIDQMLSEMDRVSKTLVGLLGLARPQAPQKVATDLISLTRDIVGLFEQRLHGRHISLAFEAPDPLPALEVDRAQLTQLVLNLLTNAEQAVRDGGSIEVRLAPFPDGEGVMLSVMDDGAGIPDRQLERIWEPFYTTKEKGTGLGLAVCRQIAELHGGTITVESEPGQGARFLVLLPRVIRG